tara:strand:+ start:31 stop:399 length:369 start_codon:yes stop_codon:yes gene_type:complete
MFDRFDICQLDRDFLNCIVAIDLMDAVELSVTLINAHRSAIGKSNPHGKMPLDMYHIVEKCDDIAWSMRNSDAQTRRAWILLGEFHANRDAPSVRKMLDMFTHPDEGDKGELCRLIERWGRH